MGTIFSVLSRFLGLLCKFNSLIPGTIKMQDIYSMLIDTHTYTKALVIKVWFKFILLHTTPIIIYLL